MGVALGHFDILVPEQLLHVEETAMLANVWRRSWMRRFSIPITRLANGVLSWWWADLIFLNRARQVISFRKRGATRGVVALNLSRRQDLPAVTLPLVVVEGSCVRWSQGEI